MGALFSIQQLGWWLGVPASELIQLAKEIDQHEHYREKSILDSKKQKLRCFKVPDRRLKDVQKRILRNILVNHPVSQGMHGGVSGRSPRTNATRHLNTECIVNIDIRDFFPSVQHRQVAKMFKRDFNCGKKTTWLLTRLTTVDGQLPQGAPTSTMIANIVLDRPVDRAIETISTQLDVGFTRFVDDITFSGKNGPRLINFTAKSVSKIGLRTWRKNGKLNIIPHWQRQEVTGLTVNRKKKPSVSKKKRDRIKTAIHQLPSLPEFERDHAINSIKGRLNYLKQFNPGSAKRLERALQDMLA